MASLNKKNVQLEDLMPVMKESLAKGHTVTFMPRGTSMLPMLHQGVDKIILSPLPTKLKKYDLPLYRRKNGQYVLHRIVKAGDTYTCCGDNQYSLEEGLTHDQMIAVVTVFTHKGKEIKVENLGYQLYCRYWCISRPLRHFVRRALGKIKRIILKRSRK